MKLEYDERRDLLYLDFGKDHQRAAKTVTITPGVHADFDAQKNLLGIEVLEASKVIGQKIEFTLPQALSRRRTH